MPQHLYSLKDALMGSKACCYAYWPEQCLQIRRNIQIFCIRATVQRAKLMLLLAQKICDTEVIFSLLERQSYDST